MKGSAVVRAAVGLVVLLTLIFMVRGWFADYREAVERARGRDNGQSQEETSAPSEDDGEGEDAAPSEDAAAPEDEAETTPADNTVVVLIDGLNFRSAPEGSARSLRGLDKGEELELLSQRDGWYEVEDGDGVKGWVSTNPSYTKTERR